MQIVNTNIKDINYKFFNADELTNFIEKLQEPEKNKNKRKIAVAGAGYVGLSVALLLAQSEDVTLVDVVQEKVDMINDGISPLDDEYIKAWLKFKTVSELHLVATTNGDEAYRDADFVIIAVPTNYDSERNVLDTSYVEAVIKQVREANEHACIVIKSTIPVGFTKQYENDNVMFSPEFLREGKALYDNLYPSRIIVGTNKNNPYMVARATEFAQMLYDNAVKPKSDAKLIMGSTEAEAVKLFSNTYLAMRVAYFNELDTYASCKDLDTRSIINGVCLDPRIGDFYNNPSFGYGGYCLPKDTKQLKANYKDVPENLIKAIVKSNDTRKKFIVKDILEKADWHNHPGMTIGIYKLAMKANSDNFRNSSIQDVMYHLKKCCDTVGMNIILYEPMLKNEKDFNGITVIKDISEFKSNSDLIITNRYSPELGDVFEKVYTRDIFGEN